MLRIHVQVNEAGAWVRIHMLKRLKARSCRFLGKRFYSDPFTVGTIETPIHLQFSRYKSMRTFHGHLLIGLFRPLAKRLAFDFWWGFSHLCPVCPYVKVGLSKVSGLWTSVTLPQAYSVAWKTQRCLRKTCFNQWFETFENDHLLRSASQGNFFAMQI